jgi:hypothetical protein
MYFDVPRLCPFCEMLRLGNKDQVSLIYCLEIKGLVRSSCCCILYNWKSEESADW